MKEKMIAFSKLEKMKSYKEFIEMMEKSNINPKKIISNVKYEKDLIALQKELIKLQDWTQKENKRIAVIFEGRDAAGKGGAIRRFSEHLNPRAMRVVALPKPTDIEKKQWYFQRYIKQLPNPGEIVFFDRSWYNRAIVEPVNNFCSEIQYLKFLQQVPEFELMLYEDGIIIIKFWFSISKAEQLKRFGDRKNNPLKMWKVSSVDNKAQALWEKYTKFKEEMFVRTHTSFSPWIIVRTNTKKAARLESIKYVLNTVPYKGKEKAEINLHPDPNVVARFYRKIGLLESRVKKEKKQDDKKEKE